MEITTETQAEAFLRAHQPLPPDLEWDDDLLQSFGSLREYLAGHPVDRLLPLLLSCLGDGNGWGHYQVLGGVVTRHQPHHVLEALRVALGHPRWSVRYWAVHLAVDAGYAGKLIEQLQALLTDPVDEVRTMATTAIECLPTEHASRLLRARLDEEKSPEVRVFIQESIDYLETRNENA